MKIVIAYADDWSGLYIDGKLKMQGHDLDQRELIRALGFECDELEVDLEWMGKVGHLPKDIKEFKLF